MQNTTGLVWQKYYWFSVAQVTVTELNMPNLYLTQILQYEIAIAANDICECM